MSGGKRTVVLAIAVLLFLFAGVASATVTLLSQTPSQIFQNTTGNLNISYGISHNSSGLNNTSVSFIFRNYDHTLNDANHSIRPPANNKSVAWNYNGQILRAANRNETLNFENNDTITGGDIHTWSGLDENNTRLTIVPVNSTYTIVNINGTTHDLAMKQMWYLDRSDMIDAPKTQLAIHKTQDVLIKFWNAEIFKGNYDFIGMGYTDTSLKSSPTFHPSDANPVRFYYLNSSYDPLGGVDPIGSGYAVLLGSLNATQWVDHVYSPGQNASYVRGAINNTLLNAGINTTEISYLYFKSNTPSSKPFYINITDSGTNTNRTFGQTDVLWIGNAAPYTAHPYTPNVWFAFVYDNTSFDHKLYVADNDGRWENSTLQSTNIGSGYFDPTTPYIDHFHYAGADDYTMTGTYHATFDIGCGVATDPDGGTVTHNLTLHYANGSLVAIINNTFTDADITHNGVYADIEFNSTPYYSDTESYTLKIVATDDEGQTAQSWLGVNFRVRVSGIQTETKVPVSIFIMLTVLMFCGIIYTLHAKTHISRIFTTLIAAWLAFMLSQMIVSGNVVRMVSALDSGDAWVHDTVAIQIPGLSYLLLFIGVIMSIFLVKFVIVFGLAVIKEAQREEM